MKNRTRLMTFLAPLLAGGAFCAAMFAVAAPAPERAADAFIAAQDQQARPAATVDYDGFEDLASQAAAHREGRLVTLEEFLDIASRDNALILDTRSRAAFDEGHIEGAVHLNFSDFTSDALEEVIGDKLRPVLIYCNNNFADDAPPVPVKRAPLALNIPTFINLYGYGYRNIFELKDQVTMDDPAVPWRIGSSTDLSVSPVEDIH